MQSALEPATYTWVVANFRTLNNKSLDGPGYIIHSKHLRTFALNLHPKLRLYDSHKSNKYHTMIVLTMEECEEVKVPVHYQLSIFDADGEKHLTRDLKVEFGKGKFNVDAQYSLSWDYLTNPANGLLVNGNITIYCELYLPSVDEDTKLSKLQADFDSLLEGGQFSDVTLVVGEKDFMAHKLVLATRSPVFRAMFQHTQTKESQESRVDIGDMSVEVFEQLLRFIYTEKIDSLEQYASELLQAADRYQLDSLKSACEKYLASSLTTESVVCIATLANMHSAERLEQQCIDYMAKHIKEVLSSDGWKSLVKSNSDLGCQFLQCVCLTNGED